MTRAFGFRRYEAGGEDSNDGNPPGNDRELNPHHSDMASRRLQHSLARVNEHTPVPVEHMTPGIALRLLLVTNAMSR